MEEISSQMTFTELENRQFLFHQEIYGDLLNHVRVSLIDKCNYKVLGI